MMSSPHAGVWHPLTTSSALALGPFFDPGTHASLMRWSILLLAVMLVVVAAVVTVSREHARTRRALDEQRRWTGLVGELSAEVVDTPAERLDATIDETIRRMLDPLAADGVYLGRFADDEDGAVQAHTSAWRTCRPPVSLTSAPSAQRAFKRFSPCRCASEGTRWASWPSCVAAEDERGPRNWWDERSSWGTCSLLPPFAVRTISPGA
jgi:hypothetical protein